MDIFEASLESLVSDINEAEQDVETPEGVKFLEGLNLILEASNVLPYQDAKNLLFLSALILLEGPQTTSDFVDAGINFLAKRRSR